MSVGGYVHASACACVYELMHMWLKQWKNFPELSQGSLLPHMPTFSWLPHTEADAPMLKLSVGLTSQPLPDKPCTFVLLAQTQCW